MKGRAIADAVLAHIGHAERWLRRARADYERGDTRQAVLRLLLAEAEIRRARESGTVAGTAAAEERPRWPRAPAPWAVLGALTAAALILAGYALMRPYAAAPVARLPGLVQAGQGSHRLNAIVRFDTGQMLPFVGFPVRPGGSGLGAAGTDVDRLITIGDDGPALATFR